MRYDAVTNRYVSVKSVFVAIGRSRGVVFDRRLSDYKFSDVIKCYSGSKLTLNSDIIVHDEKPLFVILKNHKTIRCEKYLQKWKPFQYNVSILNVKRGYGHFTLCKH